MLPLTMRREYTVIVFLCKYSYGNYDVDVNDFTRMVDAPLVTRFILDF